MAPHGQTMRSGLSSASGGEDNIQEELDGTVRNQVIFNNIATKMRERGYERDWQQRRTKLKKNTGR